MGKKFVGPLESAVLWRVRDKTLVGFERNFFLVRYQALSQDLKCGYRKL